jgi:hypothetical protein
VGGDDEESYSFFYPFDQNAKPTASDLETMGEISKTKALKHHSTIGGSASRPMEQLYVTDGTTGDMGAASEVTPDPVQKPKRTRSKVSVETPSEQAAPSTPPVPETIPSEPVEAAPAADPVEAVPAGPVSDEHSAPVEVLAASFVLFDKSNKEHAHIVAGWFREANPEWTKSPDTITLCRKIAADMDGKPFLMGDGIKVPCPDMKALAIKSVLVGVSHI